MHLSLSGEELKPSQQILMRYVWWLPCDFWLRWLIPLVASCCMVLFHISVNQASFEYLPKTKARVLNWPLPLRNNVHLAGSNSSQLQISFSEEKGCQLQLCLSGCLLTYSPGETCLSLGDESYLKSNARSFFYLPDWETIRDCLNSGGGQPLKIIFF